MINKYMTKYNENYVVMVPVYYDYETRPAWRKYYIGTKKECENILATAPDHLTATTEENKANRTNKIKEYALLLKLGKKKQAETIKAQYNL